MAAKAVRTRARGLAKPAAELVRSGVLLGVAVPVFDRLVDLVPTSVVVEDDVVRVMFMVVTVMLWVRAMSEGTEVVLMVVTVVLVTLVALTEATTAET